jgi:universal stress protein E
MSASIRTVLVGVAALHDEDPAVSPRGVDPVLAPALRLAETAGAVVHVVHAFELPDPLLWSYSGFTTVPDARVLQDYRARAVAMLEAQVAELGTGATVRCHAEEGAAGPVICRLAEQLGADLVVVGATRRGKLWRGLLGTTADRVVRGAPAPVLVMHQPFEGPVRRVLLTTDLSTVSAGVHERGLDVVEALFGTDPELRSLMVVAFDAVLPPPLRESLLQDAAETEQQRFLEARVPRTRPVEPRVRVGEIPRQVAREVEEWGADLVVVGTSGRSGASRLLLGSNAAATLRSVGCNVLVIPASILPRAETTVRVEAAAQPVASGVA